MFGLQPRAQPYPLNLQPKAAPPSEPEPLNQAPSAADVLRMLEDTGSSEVHVRVGPPGSGAGGWIGVRIVGGSIDWPRETFRAELPFDSAGVEAFNFDDVCVRLAFPAVSDGAGRLQAGVRRGLGGRWRGVRWNCDGGEARVGGTHAATAEERTRRA